MSPSRLTRSFAALAFAIAVLVAASPASAQVWNEVGDAGDAIPGYQITAGGGALTTITGTLSASNDVDLYCIRLDRSTFIASIPCLDFMSAKDLWLFQTDGVGVELNDGCSGGLVQLVGPGFVFANGAYVLGITGSEIDAFGATDLIWAPGPVPTMRAPDGPNPTGALTGWTGSPVVFAPLNYTIQLQGCTFCDETVPATSATWGRVKSSYR